MGAIEQPELFRVRGTVGTTWGASQTWYGDRWQRSAGCGPTACAHLLWYLSHTRGELRGLCPYGDDSRAALLRLMEEVWAYVTPGKMGVNKTSTLAQGALSFGADRSIALETAVLDVPADSKSRPALCEVEDYLHRMFKQDLPVAFLNLSNGELRNLESWHWVTLISADAPERVAVLDQGRKYAVDLALWLDTTLLGGGFVAVMPG